MALRNQPYIPLYIQDFLTDEKLIECSPEAHGVYIRTMCVMHKSERYGTILLKQKDKQSDKQIINFANKLARFLPWNLQIIINGLEELLTENVLQIDGDFLIQKRMEKDGLLSDKRSLAGSKGGKKTTSKKQNFAQAKNQANSEVEYEYENEVENNNGKESLREKPKTFSIPTIDEISTYCQERQNTVNPQKFFDFYEGKGWMVGKNKMKDWKACVRTWEDNSSNNKTKTNEPKQVTSKQQFRFNSSEAIKTITGGN